MDNEIIYADEVIEEAGASGAKIGLLALGCLAVAGAIGGVLKKARAKKLADIPSEDNIAEKQVAEEN